ncbi:MAG: sel1 repeat family protein [Bosea sp.]|uniref:tetratricopeptide repeat protein n=2 Tax=Bosea sp. (in: a-proteobacteria) TaxID=1871050 RepID=UPI0031FEC572|nr:sel1 repeat family protein [Bosea sp. (in: a-proteobacteria)]
MRTAPDKLQPPRSLAADGPEDIGSAGAIQRQARDSVATTVERPSGVPGPARRKLMADLRRLSLAALRAQPPDYAQARFWLLHASRRGDVWASLTLGRLHGEGLGGTADPERAVRLFRKAGRSGDPEGMFRCGIAFQVGEGVPEDGKEAARWYARAARAGHACAAFNLATMLAAGAGIARNPARAIRFYEQAAAGGETRAMVNLANIHVRGEVAPENLPEAARLYGLAVEKGDAGAAFHLAQLHFHGYGVARDLVLAKALLLFADRQDFQSAREMLEAVDREMSAAERRAAVTEATRRWGSPRQ